MVQLCLAFVGEVNATAQWCLPHPLTGHESQKAESHENLQIQGSKTDQTGETATLHIGDKTKHLINRYLRKADITAGAVFVRFKTTKSGPQPTDQRLTDRAARDIIKHRAELAGVEGKVSGHSLRVGTAVSLSQAGAGISEMQDAGRWESQNMPGHYARVKEAEKGAVARYRYGKGK